MSSINVIVDKLEKFTKKYYFNELIKGSLIFVGVSILYFLIIVAIENFLWLNNTGRAILFWIFIGVVFALFVKYICIPVIKILRLIKGIDHKTASKLIGNHFNEVNDKLINLLQLNDSDHKSSLLIASIEQRSKELSPIPFKLAIDLKNNIKYIKYTLIPLGIVLVFILLNQTKWISNSYNRVVNYDVSYQPPAPFEFFIINDSLSTHEDQNFILKVSTSGSVIPDNASIIFDDQEYFLQTVSPGNFEYTFNELKTSFEFILKSNEVSSKRYKLSVLPIPLLLNVDMKLSFPNYIRKNDEYLISSGNATIPEGTKVEWIAKTRNTKLVHFHADDTIQPFVNQNQTFFFNKQIFSNLKYDISSSNDNVTNYSKLSYSIRVIKDQNPEMNIKSIKDSLNTDIMYFFGQVSDDYGLRNLRMVYYESNDISTTKHVDIPVNKGLLSDFQFTFPNDIKLKDGVSYEVYFEVFDNDYLHNYKSTKSSIFSIRKQTLEEKEEQKLNNQNETIQGFNEDLKKFSRQNEELNNLSKIQKENKSLGYNDQKKLENILKQQQEQTDKLNNFMNKLKKNLDSEERDESEKFPDELKERIERNQEKLKKNQELLKEIEELTEKINKEDLTKSLETLEKNNKNIKKNLEQLLELTKRFYVEEKYNKLADKLEELSKKQDELSKSNNETSEEKKAQEKLNEAFEKFQEEMNKLKEKNEKLNKPMDLKFDKSMEEKIKEEQEKALDELNQDKKESSKKNQKAASEMMKQMSDNMKSNMSMAGEEQQVEDMNMLRQILDNLVSFSFGQEDLMDDFKSTDVNHPGYSTKLKNQNSLKENFIHIDDSLYALAMRTPKITDKILDELTEVEFNIDKSLDKLAENQIMQGVSHQQYIISGANELAYWLSITLDNMQDGMNSSGSGQSSPNEFQLPDIIKKQGELNEQMKGEMSKGQQPGNKNQEQGKDQKSNGNSDGNSEGTKEGKNNSNAKDSKEGDGSSGEGTPKESILGEGEDEYKNGKLFEIYKQQQILRNALESKMKEMGLDKGDPRNSSVLRKMREAEQSLINKGFNDETLSRMIKLKHQLLKLETGTFTQNKDNKRKSTSNTKTYDGSTDLLNSYYKEYFNSIEILNRQALPLRNQYKEKVLDYFNNSND